MLRVSITSPPLKVGSLVLYPGDPIPQAAGPNFYDLRAYLSMRFIIDDADLSPEIRASARLGDALRLDLPRQPGGAGAPSSPLSVAPPAPSSKKKDSHRK